MLGSRKRVFSALRELNIQDEKFEETLVKCKKHFRVYYRQKFMYVCLGLCYMFTWYRFRFYLKDISDFTDILFIIGTVIFIKLRPKINLKEEISYLNKILKEKSYEVVKGVWNRLEDGRYSLSVRDSIFGKVSIVLPNKGTEELDKWLSLSNKFKLGVNLNLRYKKEIPMLPDNL